MQKKIDEILKLIPEVEPEERSKIVQAVSGLKSKMKELAVPQDIDQARSYATKLTQQALEEGVLPQYGDDELVRTKKSTQHKEVIREVVKQFDVVADIDNPALGLAWNRVKKSTSILELRTNLEMYIVIKDSIHKNDIQEYVDFIDEQDKQIKELLEYKRLQEELFGIVFEDDVELKLLSDIENAKLNHNLTDTQVCAMFDCSRRKLQTLREKYNLVVLKESQEIPSY